MFANQIFNTAKLADLYEKDIKKIEKESEFFDKKKLPTMMKTGKDLSKKFKSIDYIHKNVFRQVGSVYCKTKDGNYVVYTTEEFKKDFVDRFGELDTYWKKNAYLPLYSAICDPTKPAIDVEKNEINLVPESKFQYEGTHKSKKHAKLIAEFERYMLHIAETVEVKQYLHKWLSSQLKGLRLYTAIYLYSVGQGHGKSVLIDLMHKLNEERGLRANLEHFSKYTGQMKGKLLVTLEEIPDYQNKDYDLFVNTLKSIITTPSFAYREIYEKTRLCPVVNCFMLTGNYMLQVKELRGRRFFPIHVRKDETIDFMTIVRAMANEEELQALFDYLYDIDTSSFSQSVQQTTVETAMMKLIRCEVDTVDDWLIRNYLLRKIDGKFSSKELYEDYTIYQENKSKNSRKTGKIAFLCKLREFLTVKTHARLEKFVINHAELFKHYKKNSMIDEETIIEYENAKGIIIEDEEEEEKPKTKEEAFEQLIDEDFRQRQEERKRNRISQNIEKSKEKKKSEEAFEELIDEEFRDKEKRKQKKIFEFMNKAGF